MVKNKTGWNRYFCGDFYYSALGRTLCLNRRHRQRGAGRIPSGHHRLTPEEFMMAIGPDRIIRIEAEVLQLPNEKVPFASDYVTQQK